MPYVPHSELGDKLREGGSTQETLESHHLTSWKILLVEHTCICKHMWGCVSMCICMWLRVVDLRRQGLFKQSQIVEQHHRHRHWQNALRWVKETVLPCVVRALACSCWALLLGRWVLCLRSSMCTWVCECVGCFIMHLCEQTVGVKSMWEASTVAPFSQESADYKCSRRFESLKREEILTIFNL